MTLTDLGPDTVELIKRDPVLDAGEPVLDAWGRPTLADRTITRDRCSVEVRDGAEQVAGTTVAVLTLRAMLPVDADTEALAPADAVRFGGRLYELTMPGIRHDYLSGDPSHVRIVGTWADDVSLGEQVTVIPAGRRDDDGVFAPDGEPVTIIARAVTPGNATIKFGGSGEQVAADYTVVLDLDAPIADGDWIVVRGRQCRATIERQESDWQERRELVVLARYRAGGAG